MSSKAASTSSTMTSKKEDSASTDPTRTIPVSPKKKIGRRRKRSIEESKAIHREVERARTKNINEKVKLLRDTLGQYGWEVKKRDKASILQAAVHCIQEFETEVKHLRQLKQEATQGVTNRP